MVGGYHRSASRWKRRGMCLGMCPNSSLARFESDMGFPRMWDARATGARPVSPESMPGQARRKRVPAVRASRNIVAGILRACLVLTCVALPTAVVAQSSQLVFLSDVTSSVDEGGTINFTVNRITDGLPLTVTVDIVPDSPIEGFNVIAGGDDTDGAQVTVTIPTGRTTVSGSIGTNDNSIVNDDVAITVSIDGSASAAYWTSFSPSTPSSADVTVRNGDDVYALGVNLGSPGIWTYTEGETIPVRFMRCVGTANTEKLKDCGDVGTPRAGARSPPALTESIFVEAQGNFFTAALPSSVTLGAGSFSTLVEIETDNDSVEEDDGGLVVRTFANSTSASRYVSFIILADNDRARISIAPVSASVTEGSDAVFTITRSHTELLPEDSFGVALTFHAKMFESTALPSTTNNLTFAEDATEVRLTVPTHGDALNEGDGMVHADLSGVANFEIAQGSTWVRIVDDDVPRVTFSVDRTSIVEGEPIEWSMTRSGYTSDTLRLSTEREYVRYYPDHLTPDLVIKATAAVTSPHFVGFVRAGETTTVHRSAGGVDYVGPDQDVVGPQGGYIKRRILPFPADRFTGIPSTGDVTFRPRYTVASSDFLRVDIANSAPGVEIESQQDSATEGGNVNFTITKYGGSTSSAGFDTRVRLDVHQTGDYLAAGETGVRTVTIATGQTTASIALATINDRLHEEDGAVTVTILSNPSTGEAEDTYEFSTRYSDLAKRYPHQSSVAVVNDDHPGVTLSGTELDIDEGGSGAYTVVLDLKPSGDVTVTPSRTSGSASVTVSGALTFTVDNWSTPQTVTVSAGQDANSADEVAVIGHAVSGADYDTVTAESVSVDVDDDDTPRVTLSLSDDSIAEDGGITTVTASLSLASSVATTVAVSVSPDSPAVAGDYEISADKVLTIAAGQTASTGTVTITGVNNDVDTADKTVKVQGAASNSVGTSGPSDATLTLEDDDTRGVTVSKADLDIDEGGSGTYTVVLDSEPTSSVVVTPSRSSGDEDVTVSGALTFTTSDWATAQTVTVRSAQDLDAVDDTAVIGHTVSGADYGAVAAAAVDVTVDDDETASSGVTLTVSPDEVGEGAAATTVTVTARLNGGTRSGATPVAVTVGSGTAASGTDFAAVAGFDISIAANTLSNTGTFTLSPTQDTLDEPDETVAINGTTTVTGFSVTGATVAIIDDEFPVVSIVADSDAIDEGEDAVFTLSRVGERSSPLTVKVAVSETFNVLAGNQAGEREVQFSAAAATARLSLGTIDDAVAETSSQVKAVFRRVRVIGWEARRRPRPMYSTTTIFWSCRWRRIRPRWRRMSGR